VNGGIYLLQDTGDLVEMREQVYESEALLQGLLGKYPSLLAGDQINSSVPRRWLLISREMGLPAEEDGSERWAVDHLLLDQDAIPTLVEVKRSSDTRIRREVVGQMLDYAANAVLYWPIEAIRARYEKNCEATSIDPATNLKKFLCGDTEEEFWQKARTNLQAGRIRLVFVADEIPPELRRIVEFLNAQMDPAEILAVEIRQYVGSGMKTLVPRVVGQTAAASQRKGNSPPPRIQTVTTLLAMADENKTTDLVKICRGMRERWVEDRIGTAQGSFGYWTYGKMVYGVNVSGQLADARPGELDVWLRMENLAHVTGIPEADIKQRFMKFKPFGKGRMDFAIRLKSPKDADLLIEELKTLPDVCLEYWQAFLQHAESVGSQFVAKPERQEWLYTQLDNTNGIGVILESGKKGHIWVGMECEGGNLWEQLKLAKDQIHQEVGGPLQWEEPTKGDNAFAGIYLEANPRDRSHWPQQHRLLDEKLKVLYPVFARWVQKLA
jgi:hypothetical protein